MGSDTNECYFCFETKIIQHRCQCGVCICDNCRKTHGIFCKECMDEINYYYSDCNVCHATKWMCPDCDNYGICDDCIFKGRELCQECTDRKNKDSNEAIDSDIILPVNYVNSICDDSTSIDVEN
jgi:hypothetical protein